MGLSPPCQLPANQLHLKRMTTLEQLKDNIALFPSPFYPAA
jgi:hypothetical protein